ncbi:hypothetical protein AAKU58_000947 [Oxalobacteraceae bacterium GrIS 1.18]
MNQTENMKHLSPLPVSAELPGTPIQQIHREIATVAARFVAEDGATYAIAKQKAAQQVLGSTRFSRECLPDNSLIEQQVHLYNQLFLTDTQPARLLHLRQLALTVMRELARYNPQLTGAVLNGSAGEHAEIVIHLFVDNSKELAIELLNRNIDFDVSESSRDSGRRQDPIETFSFARDTEGIHLVLFATDDVRHMSAKKSPRANIDALEKLIQESSQP